MSSDNHPRITTLGTGTCVPSLRRSACSVLVETGTETILLDAGPGTMRRLLEHGTTVFDVTHIFFSHFHPDHTGELATFLFANNYPDSTRRKNNLTISGGPGFRKFFSGLEQVYGNWIRLEPQLFRILELNPAIEDRWHTNRTSVSFSPVEHRPESLAYRLNFSDGISVVYSGDTDFSEDLVVLADGADVLICESALPDGSKAPGHLTPSLAGEIARRARVRMLVLTHFYPDCDQADIAGQCRNTYAGTLFLAEDLWRIPLEILQP
ncbi:MAG: MBL fold metallo-hydrolase [Thermodesulfobacteriota bacterium]